MSQTESRRAALGNLAYLQGLFLEKAKEQQVETEAPTKEAKEEKREAEDFYKIAYQHGNFRREKRVIRDQFKQLKELKEDDNGNAKIVADLFNCLEKVITLGEECKQFLSPEQALSLFLLNQNFELGPEKVETVHDSKLDT